MDSKIREEQDAAYLESLRIDQEKVYIYIPYLPEYTVGHTLYFSEENFDFNF